jgi:hypothetical protein
MKIMLAFIVYVISLDILYQINFGMFFIAIIVSAAYAVNDSFYR